MKRGGDLRRGRVPPRSPQDLRWRERRAWFASADAVAAGQLRYWRGDSESYRCCCSSLGGSTVVEAGGSVEVDRGTWAPRAFAGSGKYRRVCAG